MPWTWIRPADSTLLRGRPLLDLGTGDGQTLEALVTGGGPVIGLDRSPQSLAAARRVTPRPLVQGNAEALPFADGSFSVVLAADLFHHLDDPQLTRVLAEIHRVLGTGGHMVAWWYAEPGRPDAAGPRHPRPDSTLGNLAGEAGFVAIHPLELVRAVTPAPRSVGMRAEV